MRRACFALALVCLPNRVVAQTPVDGWSGQVQCLIASRGVGYEDDQTHTWVLSGMPGVRSGFRDYPATWTVSGSGRRTPVSARASVPGAGEAWTYSGTNASASITLSVPVGTGTIRIAGGQRAVAATNGIKGTTATAPFAANVAEWRFQYIDVVNGAARTTLSDSRTQSRSDLAGWRPPPGTTVTETCSWKLAKSGASTDGGANAKGGTAAAGAAGAGTAAAGTARGAVIPEGAAPAGGAASAAGAAATGAASAAGGAAASTTAIGGAAGSAAGASTAGAAKTGGATGAAPAGGGVAGAASAGAPSPSTATTKPAGGGAASGAAAAASGGAANNPTTAGSSSSALSPDVMRPYTAIGRTPTPGTGVVVATLVDDTGAPLVGVSIADIRLVDATSLPVGVGPYMFGTTGDIVDSNTLRATASFDGRSRVAFLDVPAGTLTLTVMYSRDGKVVTRSARVITKAGAITAVQP